MEADAAQDAGLQRQQHTAAESTGRECVLALSSARRDAAVNESAHDGVRLRALAPASGIINISASRGLETKKRKPTQVLRKVPSSSWAGILHNGIQCMLQLQLFSHTGCVYRRRRNTSFSKRSRRSNYASGLSRLNRQQLQRSPHNSQPLSSRTRSSMRPCAASSSRSRRPSPSSPAFWYVLN